MIFNEGNLPKIIVKNLCCVLQKHIVVFSDDNFGLTIEMISLEVCVDSILSAVNASEGGADRIELCSALSEGGLTPSLGLFQGVKNALQESKTKVFCMIRIRRGNFNFSADEVDAMVHDVEYFKSQKSDGIVIGCLDEKGEIHKSHCEKLISAWGDRGTVTFHRAFDETNSKYLRKNLKIISDLGIKRILSSGFEISAEKGIENLTNLVKEASELGISVMPGAGITSSNAGEIVDRTNAKEIHASARSPSTSDTSTKISMGGSVSDLEPLMICDKEKVQDLKNILGDS